MRSKPEESRTLRNTFMSFSMSMSKNSIPDLALDNMGNISANSGMIFMPLEKDSWSKRMTMSRTFTGA